MKFQTILVIGSPLDNKKQILSLLKDEGLKISSNSPDIQIIKPEKKHISIDQIRELKKHIYQKPFKDKKKIIIIENCELLTDQAQNALLKVLEEPPSYAKIFLSCVDKKLLIPTILSRSILVVSKIHTNSEEKIFKYIGDQKIENILQDINLHKNYEKWIDYQILESHKKLLDNIKHNKEAALDISEKVELLIQAKKMIQANVNPKFALSNLVFSIYQNN